MSNFFLTDLYLQDEIASPPSEQYPQNYYRLKDNASLTTALPDFATCLMSNISLDAVEFPGWEKATISDEYGHSWNRVAYGNGVYVAGANDVSLSAAPGMMASSSDGGVTWTIHTTPGGPDFECYDLLWANSLGLFIAGGYNGDNNFNILTSPDGVNWTARQTGLGQDGNYLNPAVHNLVWAESLGRLVASNYWGTLFHYSDDGINWTWISSEETQFNSPISEWALTAIAWSETEGTFSGLGNQINKCITSPDGINWTMHDAPEIALFRGFDMAWSPTLNLFAAFGEMGSSNGPVYTSTDGINWTERPPNFVVNTVPGTNPFLPFWSGKWNEHLNKFELMSAGDSNWPGFFTTPSLYIIESSDGLTWDITPGIPGIHNYGIPVISISKFRDTENKSPTEKVLVGELGIFYSVPI